MDKQKIYDLAFAAVGDRSIVDRLYDDACAWVPVDLDDDSKPDLMADAMAVEAVWKYLVGQVTTAPEWADGLRDPDGVRVAWVTIATGETVPVFIPGDGRVIYSEW